MDYLKPGEIAKNMLQTAVSKASLSVSGFPLFCGFPSAALLGFATCLAFTASKQTTLPIAGALIFPVGFVLIVLLGLELVTGNSVLYLSLTKPNESPVGNSRPISSRLPRQSFGECLLWRNVCPHALAEFGA